MTWVGGINHPPMSCCQSVNKLIGLLRLVVTGQFGGVHAGHDNGVGVAHGVSVQGGQCGAFGSQHHNLAGTIVDGVGRVRVLVEVRGKVDVHGFLFKQLVPSGAGGVPHVAGLFLGRGDCGIGGSVEHDHEAMLLVSGQGITGSDVSHVAVGLHGLHELLAVVHGGFGPGVGTITDLDHAGVRSVAHHVRHQHGVGGGPLGFGGTVQKLDNLEGFDSGFQRNGHDNTPWCSLYI